MSEQTFKSPKHHLVTTDSNIFDIHICCSNASYFKEYSACLKSPLQVDEERGGDRNKGDEDNILVTLESLIPGSPVLC